MYSCSTTVATSCSRLQPAVTGRARGTPTHSTHQRISLKLRRGLSSSGEPGELQPRHFGNAQAPPGDTAPAVPPDHVRPHDRHEHHRDFRPLPVRVLGLPLTGGNVPSSRERPRLAETRPHRHPLESRPHELLQFPPKRADDEERGMFRHVSANWTNSTLGTEG